MLLSQIYRCYTKKAGYARLRRMFVNGKWVRNWAVEQCRNAHKVAEKHPSYFTLTKLWTAARNADERNLEFGVTEQRSVIRGVTEGYKRFFNKHHARPPRFSGDLVKSFRLLRKPERVRRQDYRVRIKGVGYVRFTDRRGLIKRHGCTFVRIVRSSLGTEYTIQVVYERPEAPENSCADTPMAVDLGCKAIATLADGTSYAPIKKSEPRRDALQRRAAKTKKDTRLRRKRFGAWRKEAERVVRRNRGYRHEVAADVVKRSANLFLDDLKVERMTRAGGSRKTGLNRSMRAQGLYELVQLLKYKSTLLGGKVELVPPNDTTQRCSACHHKPEERLRLADRKHRCAMCGKTQCRDVNAALNVLYRGHCPDGWAASLSYAQHVSAHLDAERHPLLDAVAGLGSVQNRARELHPQGCYAPTSAGEIDHRPTRQIG